jgi:phage shock protein PspC (stress-responsive transcriptional regulator)
MNDRLHRSAEDRVIGGVCAGLAEQLGIDPTLVRIVWALLILPTGFIALAVYLVMWLVVPEAPYTRSIGTGGPAVPRHPAGGRGMPFFVGGTLIVLGAWFLLRDLFPALDPGRFWPVALVILGIGLIVWAFQRSPGGRWGHRP